MSELSEQMALFRFLRLWRRKYPALGLVHSSLNGVPLPPSQCGKMKAAGMVAGVWDICLPVPRLWQRSEDTSVSFAGPDNLRDAIFTCLYIEMKVGRNPLTPEQAAFRDALCSTEVNRHADDDLPCLPAFVVCRTWYDAARCIGEYLQIPKSETDFWKAVAPPPMQRPLFGRGSRGPRKVKAREEVAA